MPLLSSDPTRRRKRRKKEKEAHAIATLVSKELRNGIAEKVLRVHVTEERRQTPVLDAQRA